MQPKLKVESASLPGSQQTDGDSALRRRGQNAEGPGPGSARLHPAPSVSRGVSMSETEPGPKERPPRHIHGALGPYRNAETSKAQPPRPASPPPTRCRPPFWFPGGSRPWVAFGQRFSSAATTLGVSCSDEVPLEPCPSPARLPRSARPASGACGGARRFTQAPLEHGGH